MTTMTYAQALNLALREEMRRDHRVMVMGEDVAVFGGIFGVTAGLIDEFGPTRVRDTPLSETAIIGGGVGAAVTGLVRPVCDLMLADFASVCHDEIYNKAGKWMYMHGDVMPVPLVIRMPIGIRGGGGAEHSQCVESLFMHGPGLKLVAPSTPREARGLLKSAIRDDNPVLFFEHKKLYALEGDVPDSEETVPIGKAAVRRQGRDVTLISYAYMVLPVLEAADRLAEEGIDAEVIDLRSLVPMDEECLFASVRKTGRAVVIHEDSKRLGAGAEISSRIHEACFKDLKAPVIRVGAPDVPIPFSPPLEELYLPNVADIEEASKQSVSF